MGVIESKIKGKINRCGTPVLGLAKSCTNIYAKTFLVSLRLVRPDESWIFVEIISIKCFLASAFFVFSRKK